MLSLREVIGFTFVVSIINRVRDDRSQRDVASQLFWLMLIHMKVARLTRLTQLPILINVNETLLSKKQFDDGLENWITEA